MIPGSWQYAKGSVLLSQCLQLPTAHLSDGAHRLGLQAHAEAVTAHILSRPQWKLVFSI
jgi:hypothetical protein